MAMVLTLRPALGGWFSGSMMAWKISTIWTIVEKNMESMHNPAHPGEVLRELYLEPLGVTVTAAAQALDVSRSLLSDLVNGKGGVTPLMALRLEKALGSSAEHWLRMQQSLDLWHARQSAWLSKVRRIKVAAAN
jgi:addiction module HigA family antidote